MTMFLCDPSLYRKSENGPVVLVAMHGDSTASSMVDVVNSLAGCGNAYAYDMPLDKDMQQAYDELKAAVQELNRGQGILLVYDMGSLRTMAEIITKETGVPIRTVALPGTLIAVDCARKANSCSSLDELQEGAMESCRRFLYTNRRAVRPCAPQQGHHYLVYDWRGRCDADEALSGKERCHERYGHHPIGSG